MIDLTPLDVRNKRGDFKKLMRGYDPHEVDVFLELAADRLEEVVRENLQLRERTQTLQDQVDAQAGREQAVQNALVTAQELRADIQAQSQREAEHVMREADAEARRVIAEAEAEARRLLAEAEAEVRDRLRGIERQLDQGQTVLADLERRRVRFLKEFRSLLEREFDVVNVEEGRAPFEKREIDLDLGRRPSSGSGSGSAEPDAPTVEGITPEAGDAVSPDRDPSDPASEAEGDAAGSPAPEVSETGSASVSDETGTSTDAPAAASPGTATAAAEAAIEEDVEAEALAPSEAPVDVTALEPDAPSAPEPDGSGAAEPGTSDDGPSTLELELMAGAASAREVQGDGVVGRGFPEVPDLETLLAEAGVEEVEPSEESEEEDIQPPPAPGGARDNVLLFDPNDPDHFR